MKREREKERKQEKKVVSEGMRVNSYRLKRNRDEEIEDSHLEEGIEGIGVEYFGPEIDIVGRGVGRGGEEVLEVRQAVAQHDALGHAQRGQLLRLEVNKA